LVIDKEGLATCQPFLSGVALLLYGAAVLVFPQALPTFQPADMMMN
jgi:hypothetical protein